MRSLRRMFQKGLKMKTLLFIFFLFSNLFSAGTYDNVFFSDYEEQAALYFCNYYPRQDFINLGITSTDSNRIINNRPYVTLLDVSSLSGIASADMQKIKAQSHLIDWNIYTDDFGMTLHQTNFIYALSGVLVGFTFMFIFLLVLVS